MSGIRRNRLIPPQFRTPTLLPRNHSHTDDDVDAEPNPPSRRTAIEVYTDLEEETEDRKIQVRRAQRIQQQTSAASLAYERQYLMFREAFDQFKRRFNNPEFRRPHYVRIESSQTPDGRQHVSLRFPVEQLYHQSMPAVQMTFAYTGKRGDSAHDVRQLVANLFDSQGALIIAAVLGIYIEKFPVFLHRDALLAPPREQLDSRSLTPNRHPILVNAKVISYNRELLSFDLIVVRDSHSLSVKYLQYYSYEGDRDGHTLDLQYLREIVEEPIRHPRYHVVNDLLSEHLYALGREVIDDVMRRELPSLCVNHHVYNGGQVPLWGYAEKEYKHLTLEQIRGDSFWSDEIQNAETVPRGIV